jgi:hypothetical protein
MWKRSSQPEPARSDTAAGTLAFSLFEREVRRRRRRRAAYWVFCALMELFEGSILSIVVIPLLGLLAPDPDRFAVVLVRRRATGEVVYRSLPAGDGDDLSEVLGQVETDLAELQADEFLSRYLEYNRKEHATDLERTRNRRNKKSHLRHEREL